MCGIAGILELDGRREPAGLRRAQIARMIELIGHRGPDEAGSFLDDRVVLATSRLRIVDLAHGQQPMSDPSGRFWIVYNGEIYNHVELRRELEQRGHRFTTRCDTEVALRGFMQWGEDAPRRFDGGYAFVIYDRQLCQAVMVRDRFGKRPLFYRVEAGKVVFGSEIKLQLACGDLQWDPAGLAACFGKWAPFGAETPFKGVRQLRAGTLLRVSRAGQTEHTWSDARLPLAGDRVDCSMQEASAHLVDLLTQSVDRRLRADVDVGVLLSGGLDSSVITHLARRAQGDRVRTFSLRFADANFDESLDQARVVAQQGVAHSFVEIAGGDIANVFCEALWHAEIPQFRTAFAPMFLLARSVREHGIRVVLSGEGADETLLGYELFKEARLLASWTRMSREERRRWIRALYPYQPHFSEANLRTLEAGYARSSARPGGPLSSHQSRFANSRFALRLLNDSHGALDGLVSALESLPDFELHSPVRKAQWIEFHTLLQGYLLSSQGDRMAFAHGVEPRCPFLSSELVQFAGRLDERLLLSEQGDEKHLLKHAFRAALPPEITAKAKLPYRAPGVTAFKSAGGTNSFCPWVEDLLAPGSLAELAPVNPDNALRLVHKLRNAAADSISPREDQAFILLLSTAALDRQFVRGRWEPRVKPSPRLVRQIDYTTESSHP